jgi:predicted GNAT family N-acyltransferase
MSYTLTSDIPPKSEELMELFHQTTWANNRTIEGIEALLKNTNTCIVIRDHNKLIGFGRALTDGIYRALIDDIIIDKNHQRKGLGGEIVHSLLDKLLEVEEIFLNCGEHLEDYYNKYGFERADCLTLKLW